jgi:hypothetical protein
VTFPLHSNRFSEEEKFAAIKKNVSPTVISPPMSFIARIAAPFCAIGSFKRRDIRCIVAVKHRVLSFGGS